ncbi:MAG: helix-turn-helix transcriptional regulator [Clostridia bacterium]|nr:helix-turn-helix transcriptional regulator [Clostridia bacterium]
MAAQRGGITTSRLLTMIRGSETFTEAVAYHDTAEEPLFKDALFEMMRQRKLSPREMISRSRIDRSYFYHIMNGKKMPGRNMVLRIGFCMQASLSEMNQLLRLAGLSGLYAKIRRDATLIFALQQKYTMEQANDLLIQAGEDPLYLENRA